MTIRSVFGGRTKLEDCMLQNSLKEPAKDWDWMTEEEQQQAIARSKAAHGFKE